MWYVAELRLLSPVMGVAEPVPFDEALVQSLLLTGKAKSWEEGHKLLPVRRIEGIPLVSVPFPLSPVHETSEMVVKKGAGELLYEMGVVKKLLTPGTGPLKNYQRFYRARYTERIAVFMDVQEGKEGEMEEILGGPLWIGKKGKFGFGRLELEGFYETDDVEDLKVRGYLIRPMPVDMLREDMPLVLWFRKESPYWRMDGRAVMGTNVSDSFEVTLEEENEEVKS